MLVNGVACPQCKHLNDIGSRYCSNCGTLLNIKKSEYRDRSLKIVIGFFLVFLVFLSVFNFTDFYEGYLSILITDGLFGLMTILFAIHNRNELKRLLKFKPLKPLPAAILLLTLVILAFLVNLFADFLNKSLFDETEMAYYFIFFDSPAPWILTIISLAVVPAVFEEVIFRGVLFNHLSKLTSIKSTIVLTTFLFAILHFSVFSLIWIFPLGLLFGYLRAKYRTLWYGIIGHFCYNSCIVVFQII